MVDKAWWEKWEETGADKHEPSYHGRTDPMANVISHQRKVEGGSFLHKDAIPISDWAWVVGSSGLIGRRGRKTLSGNAEGRKTKLKGKYTIRGSPADLKVYIQEQ